MYAQRGRSTFGMAFCPECGKQAAPEAANCAGCGYAFPATEKKVGANRFKGTVMMAAGAPAEAAPANGYAVVIEQAPISVAAPAAPVAPNSGNKRNGKATMMGQGIAPAVEVAPPHTNVSAGHKATIAHGQMAPQNQYDQQPPTGYATTQPSAASAAAYAEPAEPYRDAQPAPRRDPRTASAAARYLPGDPMAPQPPAAAARSSQRLHIHEEVSIPVRHERQWLYWALCGVVVVSVLVLAIGLF
jgi:hypothetical protein